MSRNSIDRISQQPATNIKRTKFSRNADYKTTMNGGLLIPFYVDDGILPGDTFDITASVLARASTALQHPVLDNAYADVYFFGVPWRLIWEHAEEFHGATDSAWNPEAMQVTGHGDIPQYTIPHISVPDGGFRCGSLADYMGIPTYTGEGETVNALPFRAYLKVWNDYFRDGNLMDEVPLNRGDSGDVDLDVSGFYGFNLSDQLAPLPVCKFHDLFTSALPYPQRGDPVSIGLSGLIPVYTQIGPNDYYRGASPSQNPLKFSRLGQSTTGFDQVGIAHAQGQALVASRKNDLGVQYPTNASLIGGQTIESQLPFAADQETADVIGLVPNNLVADSTLASAVTINELRLAVQMQAILEADARGGVYYKNLVAQHFGVLSPDGRLQRAEYLGGQRIALNTQEVMQTSMTVDNAALGDVGAMSKTVDRQHCFTKSFTEHTVLIGLICIRTDQSYQQGLNRMWSKKNRFDYYLPALAHLGEFPVKNREIFWQNATDQNDEVFGYQEPWYEYRFRPNLVTGYMRSNASLAVVQAGVDVDDNALAGSLDSWHYGEYYKSLPKLGKDWITQGKEVIDRTLAVSSDIVHQYLVDIYIQETCTRPMPLYSIPGFGGHF